MKRILISGILIGLFITLGTVAAILYATGYRFDLKGNGTGNIKFIEGTGLLVATSRPDGARVLVNDNLTTATNNTINLSPGEYDVRIEKDGYLAWHKKIIIKKGLVSEANSFLFPTAPKLEAVTTIGVSNVTMDLNGSLLAYTVASASASKNGIYVLNMNSRPLIFLGATGNQIVTDNIDNFSQAQELLFSPDARQILAKVGTRYYLISTSGENDNPQDVTNTLLLVTADFEQQRLEQDKKLMDSLSRELRPVASVYFKDIVASPRGDKLLYTASASANLPIVLKKPAPSLNSTADQRSIREANIYVYDIREDKNYLISDKTNKYLWHADSRHLIYARDGKINIMEYDAGNLTTVYNGPFLDNRIFPWPDGSSVGIVTSLSSAVPHNLYRISLQ